MGYLYLFSLQRSHSVSKRDKPFFESEFHENLSTSFLDILYEQSSKQNVRRDVRISSVAFNVYCNFVKMHLQVFEKYVGLNLFLKAVQTKYEKKIKREKVNLSDRVESVLSGKLRISQVAQRVLS